MFGGIVSLLVVEKTVRKAERAWFISEKEMGVKAWIRSKFLRWGN
jgi:hypothetical protein